MKDLLSMGNRISALARTHSSVLAWRIPGTEGPGGLPSVGLHRVRHDWSDLAAAAAAARKKLWFSLILKNWNIPDAFVYFLLFCSLT